LSFGAGFMRVKLDTNVARNFAWLLTGEDPSHIHHAYGVLERVRKKILGRYCMTITFEHRVPFMILAVLPTSNC